MDDVKPKSNSYVLISAPHTSNWDFVWGMLAGTVLGLKFSFMAKDSLFFWPLGPLLVRLGGIPINRKQHNSIVSDIVDQYKDNDQFCLLITPEGTRTYRPYWKSGFYHIAHLANVPIVMGYLDYSSKTIGIGPTLYPTGSLDKDLVIIRQFYENKSARYPEKKSDINIT